MSRHSLYSHGEIRHCDPDSSAVDTGREEGVVSPVSAGRGKGTGAAASAADARVGVQVGPYCAFADVSAAAPAIADTARRIRFITASFFSRKVSTPIGQKQFWLLQEFKVPGTLREQMPRGLLSQSNCLRSMRPIIPARTQTLYPDSNTFRTSTRLRSTRCLQVMPLAPLLAHSGH